MFIQLPDGWRTRDNKFIGLVQWNDDTGAGTSGVGAVLGTREDNGKHLNIVRDVLPTSTNWPNVTNLLALRLNVQIPVILD